jgi:hypothetical protein
MEAIRTTETLVNFHQTRWRNIPEHRTLYACCRENLKSRHVSVHQVWQGYRKRVTCHLLQAIQVQSQRSSLVSMYQNSYHLPITFRNNFFFHGCAPLFIISGHLPTSLLLMQHLIAISSVTALRQLHVKQMTDAWEFTFNLPLHKWHKEQLYNHHGQESSTHTD